MNAIDIILGAVGIYLATGILFGIVFAFAGASKIDPAAEGGSTGFKLLIIPGCALFWPLLLGRWVRGKRPPIERSAHRDAARPEGADSA